MKNVELYTAIPFGSENLVKSYGLLSAVKVVDTPEVLKVARPDKKDRDKFVKTTNEIFDSEHPESVLGPSAFFTLPDMNKITDEHFIKKWKLQTVKIDLTHLLQDYPNTIVFGVELIPFPRSWRDLSDEDFDLELRKLGFKSWDQFTDQRRRILGLHEITYYTNLNPKYLWKDYDLKDSGKYYASNVPHALILTPMGYIPPKYIKFD